jgi:subtilisin-like proprotein convertase family protein
VNHQRQGDLIVTLRSPTGKTVTLLSAVAKNKASPRNLVFANKTVSGFSGLSANGTWTLTVKDAYRSDTGSIQSGSLEITTK